MADPRIHSSNALPSPDLPPKIGAGAGDVGQAVGSPGVWVLQSARPCLQPHLQHRRRIRGPTTGIRGGQELSRAVGNTQEISLGFVSLSLTAPARAGRGNRILLSPFGYLS